MADMTDVADALVTLIAAAMYPNGIGQPSVVETPIKVFQGWPTPQTLDKDFAAGVVDISVFPSAIARQGPFLPTEKSLGQDADTGKVLTMLRREVRQFQISVWASCFDKRDPVSGALDALLADINRVDLPDGQTANIEYVSSRQDDGNQKQGVYRRDLMYQCDYATTRTDTLYVIKHTVQNTSIGPTFDVQGPVHTITQP